MMAALKEFVDAWMLKADHDLITAQRLLEIEPMILDNACFHCQQAVEKSLKALLCYHGKEIEKTHSINFLLGECSLFDLVFTTIDPLSLNAYAVKGRYPDLNEMPEVEEARAYYQLAIHINTLVKDRLIFSA